MRNLLVSKKKRTDEGKKGKKKKEEEEKKNKLMAKRFRFFLISDFPFFIYTTRFASLPFSPLSLFHILPYRHFLSFLLSVCVWRDLLCHIFGGGLDGWMDGWILLSFRAAAAKRREALKRSIGLLSGPGRPTILRDYMDCQGLIVWRKEEKKGLDCCTVSNPHRDNPQDLVYVRVDFPSIFIFFFPFFPTSNVCRV